MTKPLTVICKMRQRIVIGLTILSPSWQTILQVSEVYIKHYYVSLNNMNFPRLYPMTHATLPTISDPTIIQAISDFVTIRIIIPIITSPKLIAVKASGATLIKVPTHTKAPKRNLNLFVKNSFVIDILTIIHYDKRARLMSKSKCPPTRKSFCD